MRGCRLLMLSRCCNCCSSARTVNYHLPWLLRVTGEAESQSESRLEWSKVIWRANRGLLAQVPLKRVPHILLQHLGLQSTGYIFCQLTTCKEMPDGLIILIMEQTSVCGSPAVAIRPYMSDFALGMSYC